MKSFNDYLKEAKLSAKQKKIAAIAGDKDKIDADDLAALRAGKKPVEEASCSDKDMKKEELVGNQYKLDKNKNGKIDSDDLKQLRGEGVLKPELEKGFPARGVKTGASAPKGTTYMPKKDVKEEVEQIDELSKKTLGSYVNKAAKDSRIHGQIATDFENTADKARKQSKKDSFERLNRKYLEKAWKREAGIGKAVDKLTKEEVEQIDEGKMKDIYTSMMHHADKKGYTSHKQFTPADYDAVGKEHGISGDDLAIIAGHKTAAQVGHERAHQLALKGMKSLSKEEVERIEEKAAQLDELSKKTLGSYVKKASGDLASSIHAERDAEENDDAEEASKAGQRASNRMSGLERAGKKIAKEEVEQEASPYLKATLAVMDEGKIDDLRDAQKLRAATKSAYDKDYKVDTSHPAITVNKGTAYGGSAQKDDEGDEKKSDNENQEKRGRGRPAGKVGKYKARGSKSAGDDVDGREYTLHLPK